MTATNHMLAGALIGAVIREPMVALPIALLSHFALDALPHFGFSSWQERTKHSKLLKTILSVDGLTLLAVMWTVLSISNSWLSFVCGIVAVSPDLIWVYRFAITEKFGKLEPQKGSWLTEFHSGIQTQEFPNGYLIEYAVSLVLFPVLLTVINV